MINTFKDRTSRIANLIGAISFGILASRYSSLFPPIHIFIFTYFLIVLGVCFLIYKSVKPGFENGVGDVAFFTIIYLIRIDSRLKSFLFGAYMFISISSIFHKVKETEKGMDPLRGILYLLITIVIVVLFFQRSETLWELTSFEDISDTMWLLFGLIGLAISIWYLYFYIIWSKKDR